MGNWDVDKAMQTLVEHGFIDKDGHPINIRSDAISRHATQPEQSEITDEQAIRHLQSTGWMQNHDREMYESGLREKLADDSGSYDGLIPCEDAVSLGVFEQVMWERDVAIEQLKELGYGFGEKKRTGHWIETAEEYYKAVNEYGGGVNEDTPYFVDDIACSECLSMFSVIDNETERFDCCPHCGAKMVEPQESEVSDGD